MRDAANLALDFVEPLGTVLEHADQELLCRQLIEDIAERTIFASSETVHCDFQHLAHAVVSTVTFRFLRRIKVCTAVTLCSVRSTYDEKGSSRSSGRRDPTRGHALPIGQSGVCEVTRSMQATLPRARDCAPLTTMGVECPSMGVDSASISEPPRPAAETSSTVHSYNVRICHWINVVACAYLLVERRPHLPRLPRAVLGAYRLSRLSGGVQARGLGPLVGGGRGARRPQVGTQLPLHRSPGCFSSTASCTSAGISTRRHFRNRMLPARDELTVAHVRTELRDHFRWRSRRHASSGSYGTLQKTSYLILIFVFVPLMILTGIAQSPGFTAAMPALLDHVRRPSVGADASHHRHRGAGAVRRRPRAGGRGRGILQSRSVR